MTAITIASVALCAAIVPFGRVADRDPGFENPPQILKDHPVWKIEILNLDISIGGPNPQDRTAEDFSDPHMTDARELQVSRLQSQEPRWNDESLVGDSQDSLPDCAAQEQQRGHSNEDDRGG